MNADDRTRTGHMRAACLEVAQFVAGQTRESLDTNIMLVRARCISIGIIGEAAGQVSADTRAEATDVPWQAIVSMRNRLFHGYFDVNLDRLWTTATSNVPALLDMLNNSFPPE